MNHLAPGGIALAGVFLAGSAWATLVTCLWPEREPHAPAPPAPARAAVDMRMYAALVGAAAGVGLALGYLLDLYHVAWAAAAALFVMRPDPHLLASRTLGRVLATFAGVAAAGLLIRRGPSEVVLAVVTVAGVAAVVAVRSSRWYVTSAGTGLLVLLASGVASRDEFAISFVERLGETALGAGLALLFGVAVPLGLRRVAPRVAGPASPTMET
jgi:uncharacterized membrane protein YccC